MAHRQKPATAAWIQRERHRLGLTTKQLSERLALIGAKVGEQTISVWESYADRRPSADNIDALERIFGSQAPEKAPAQMGEGLAELVAAIRDQTRVMGELVSELRSSHSLSSEVRERVAAVEAYAAEHERRLQADLLRTEPEQSAGSRTESPLAAARR